MNVKKYMDMIANYGCVICGQPSQLHHPRSLTGLGMGQKAPNWLVIPLCESHHREIHQNMNIDGKYEHDLLAMTIQRTVTDMSNNRNPF